MKHLKIKVDTFEVNWNIILKNIDFTLNSKDRISLVGWNWVGKTTLMKILTWEIKDYSWNIENIWNLKIWYLSQIYSDNEEKTVREELKDGFSYILEIEKELKQMEEQMNNTDPNEESYSKIVEKYSETLDKYNNIWWYNYNNQIHNVASGMWIIDLIDKKLNCISWWQRTKVALCKILLESPDILLLDEPTNFIDLAGIKWLESYLQNKWTWGYFIISHDREFLDKVCDKTYELQYLRQINFYHWNYSYYVSEREKVEKRKMENWQRQQEFIKKEENLINRFRAGSRASFAKSREKALDRLEKIDKPYIPKKPRFYFDYTLESNERIFLFKNAFIGREDPLFYINEISLHKWQRVWIIWENWVWKSTFLKTIMWQIETLDGQFIRWKWLKIWYYSQLHEELDKQKTVKENFEKQWFLFTEQEMIAILSHYLFEREDIDKKVDHLSGGQRSKLLFAILGQKDTNVLILDEPTNHLDYDTREALEACIQKYPWTILFISHDRYFVNKLASHIWIIENEELSISYGNYEDYSYKKEFGIDFAESLFDQEWELNLVLEEKLGEKEAKRLKNKFKKR